MEKQSTTNVGGPYPTLCSQGWECPKCHRVYSPWTSMCFYCGQPETITYTTETDYAWNKPK